MSLDYNIKDFKEIELKLQQVLDEERYIHTIGVAYTAANMAMNYNMDPNKAYLAGLLHDCAKCLTNEEKLQSCKDNNIPISSFELDNPFLLHSKLGAFFAKSIYMVNDEEILSAITYHTTGKPDMSLFEKIIYIADYIEPNRKTVPYMAEIRFNSYNDIDKAMYLILNNTIGYIESQNRPIDQITKDTFEFYKAAIDKQSFK